MRVLDRRAALRCDAEPARSLEVDVRRRLPRATSSDETVAVEVLRDPGDVEDGVDELAVRRRREPEREARREARTASTAPGMSGRWSRYAASIRRTTSALISSGSSGMPAVSCR